MNNYYCCLFEVFFFLAGKMRTSTCLLYALVALAALCHVGLTSPIVKRQVLNNPQYIDPAEQVRINK